MQSSYEDECGGGVEMFVRSLPSGDGLTRLCALTDRVRRSNQNECARHEADEVVVSLEQRNLYAQQARDYDLTQEEEQDRYRHTEQKPIVRERIVGDRHHERAYRLRRWYDLE